MERLHLYTEKYFLWPRLKYAVKSFLGRSWRGPQAVEKSLIMGLSEMNVPFDINAKFGSFEIACVLSGVETLRQAIAWKQQGIIKKIIAGPNLVITPNDDNKIIQHPAIDLVLQPSQWSCNFYESLAPELAKKLRIWPAGVMVPEQVENHKTLDFIVYNKSGNSSLFYGIIDILKKKHLSFKILNYGQFNQEGYFLALSKVKGLIYLSESESQGLAMFEAWSRDIPALVWERGFWKYGEYTWKGNTASPYVTSGNGLRFKDLSEFPEKLDKFLKTDFHPRNFIEEDFSWAKSAEKYMDIYRELAAK